MSEAAVRLIPLQCPRCQTPVPAQVDEVAWVCEQCRQGILLSDEQGVKPIDVFFSAAVAQGAVGKPFWVTRGSVTPVSRESYQGNRTEEMRQFWSVARLFFIPAYRLGVEDQVALGVRMLNQPAQMQVGGPVGFLPVVVPPQDVQAISEYIVMSVEAGRKDALRELKFNIQLDPPQLWVLA